jgi:hypothetical protein
MNKNSPTGKRRRPALTRAQVPSPEYDTPREFARRAKIGRTTVWRMMRDGRLRYALFGPRTPRIPTTEYQRLAVISTETT